MVRIMLTPDVTPSNASGTDSLPMPPSPVRAWTRAPRRPDVKAARGQGESGRVEPEHARFLFRGLDLGAEETKVPGEGGDVRGDVRIAHYLLRLFRFE